MLYYGDRVRTVDPRAAAAKVAARLERARAVSRAAREEPLLAALVEAGELAQGLADLAFEAAGHDGEDGPADAALAVTLSIARAYLAARAGVDAARPPEVCALLGRSLPALVTTSVPEGYAHYALYPDVYAEAARTLARDGSRWGVIGIRSIGTSLAAVVAAACGCADGSLFTVRPTGHPYHRAIRAGPSLEQRVRAALQAGTRFAVVDEGPGRSGSSLACVAGWLATLGASPEAVVVLPAHVGPLGPAATPERRAWWDGAERRAAAFEDVVLPRLAAAVRRELGAARIDDLGGGRWRGTLGWNDDGAPPVFAMQERRKYLASERDRAFVVRFAGIGPYAEASLERGRALAAAGWAPEPLAVFPGFLATVRVLPVPTRDRGRGCGPVEAPSIPEAQSYLAFRASAFPARDGEGAPAERLVEMIRLNATEALGPDAERSVDALVPATREAASLPRVAVDAKVERWEWTRSPEGRPWKLDAVDHAFGHDLVGCQPITWDVVGARVELGWTPDEAVAVAAEVLPDATRAVLALHEAAYLAHRVARWAFALDQEADVAERARIERALAQYRALLQARLVRGAAYP